ncbi:MAG: polyketide synthase [Rhodoglobus sp.]|nr:polyketide synthase [Rhodoglobus sp.]
MTGTRVALITGASSGIGRGIAERLAADGITVVVNSRNAPETPLVLADGTSPLHIAGDVADEADVIRMIAEIEERYGRLDIVVNSAGYTKFVDHADLDGISVDDWHRILDVNVIGAWNVVKASAALLEASGDGVVISVSSSAGIRVAGSSLPYSVSKAALNQLTRTLARALGPRGIRVNAVAPGFVDTQWTAGYGERREEVARIAPLRRVATPMDVADAVALLLGASYVTGEILLVDGGLTLVD